MAKNAYLSRKLLNQLAAIEADSDDMMLTHDLHNIAINGKKVGCSGHIANLLNGKCVYVNTEKAIYQPLSDKNLVRYAADMKDCSSIGLGVMGRNQFVTDDALVQKIIDMLH
jgi:hypothetical protein